MQVLKLFFIHTNIYAAAIVGASTISSTPNFYTQWGGSNLYFKSLERPGWDSNPCLQSLVTSALDHYATNTLWYHTEYQYAHQVITYNVEEVVECSPLQYENEDEARELLGEMGHTCVVSGVYAHWHTVNLPLPITFELFQVSSSRYVKLQDTHVGICM